MTKLNESIWREELTELVTILGLPAGPPASGRRPWLEHPRPSRWWAIFAVLFLGNPLLYSTLAESLVPPPKPAVPPLIAETYPNDADGDRIDDGLGRKAVQALADQQAAVTLDQKSHAQAALAALVDVELVFKQPVTQPQIDHFIALGGEITYLYKAVSYGWNGRIPLGKVSELPAAMGRTLVLIDGPRTAAGALLEATRSGRVRPIWAPGFAGNALGFEGTTNITIAILDSGVDDTHPDLAGRVVYRQNFTDEVWPTSGVHGTFSAGVVLGTGAAGESNPGTLSLSAVAIPSDFPISAQNGFYATPFEIPSGIVTVTLAAQWDGGGGTTLSLASYDKGKNPALANLTLFSPVSGTSPLTLTTTVTGDVNRVFTPKLDGNSSMSNYVLTCQISNYPSAGDGFNKLRGVAPGCNYADAKMGYDLRSTPGSYMKAAIDGVAYSRVESKIKVLNLGWYLNGNPGIDAALRQKINSAVNNGIVVALAAGNDGSNATEPERIIDDPGRAALALTLGGASDSIQLIAITSHGFYYPDTTPGLEEDYKPDLIGPSGARFESFMLAPDNNANDGGFPEQQVNDYIGMAGTSMATAFAAGCAALVIEAMETQGIEWDFFSARHALFVKMLLCATASESNRPRYGALTGFDPTLERAANGPNGFPAGKDPYEGYGMINPDAAVQAVCLSCTNGDTVNASFGSTPSDRRVWARNLTLEGGRIFVANLTVPSTGDFDLYLYSAEPGVYGTPVILASSTRAGSGTNEFLNYLASSNTPAFLVVKRVLGLGEFTLVPDVAPPPRLASPTLNGNDLTLSFHTLAGRTYYIEYKDFLNDTAWQQLPPVLGNGLLNLVTNSISNPTQRFYRLRVE